MRTFLSSYKNALLSKKWPGLKTVKVKLEKNISHRHHLVTPPLSLSLSATNRLSPTISVEIRNK